MINPNREYQADQTLPKGVSRIAIGIEYSGSNYHGWQRQPKHDAIANRVEAALSNVANHSVLTVCAGRTDAGVHANYQVAHFDTTAQRLEKGWVQGSNRLLPRDISITWAKPMAAQFHARFSAIERSYTYIIDNSAHRPALLNNQVTWEHRPLNTELMLPATKLLLGTHDFSAFRAQGCQAKSPVRTIIHCDIQRKQHLVIFKITADAFLYRMIRNIMGALIPVGLGYSSIEQFKTILDSRDRSCAGNTAPAYGLYLTSVKYPKPFELPIASHPFSYLY